MQDSVEALWGFATLLPDGFTAPSSQSLSRCQDLLHGAIAPAKAPRVLPLLDAHAR